MIRARHGTTPIPDAGFQRILLVKPSSLGDVIHALPVLHGLRGQFPQARIDWLIGSNFAPILKGNKDVTGLIEFDRKRFSRLGLSHGATRDFLALVRLLRANRYDLVIDLQGLFRSGFLSRATGAPVRLGFANAREGATLFYTHLIPIPEADEHAVDRNLRVAAMLGAADWNANFDLGIDDALRSQIRSLLNEHGIRENEKVLAVAPGARWETKIWPWQNFGSATDELIRRTGARVILLGGPDDAALCNRIAGVSKGGVASLAGRTDIRQMVAIIERCDVLLCQDSAPMHVAAALGRPLLCLIGPTNATQTGPYRRLSDVLQLSLPCSPCYLRTLAECGYDHHCMRELRVEDVVARVERLLMPHANALS